VKTGKAQLNDLKVAAIASAGAAHHYKMEILQEGMG